MGTYTTGPSLVIKSGQWVLIPHVPVQVSAVASGFLQHVSDQALAVASGYSYNRSQLVYQKWPVGTYTTGPRWGINNGQWVLIPQVPAQVSVVASGYLYHRSQPGYQQWPVGTYTTGPSSGVNSGQWVLIANISGQVSVVVSGYLQHISGWALAVKTEMVRISKMSRIQPNYTWCHNPERGSKSVVYLAIMYTYHARVKSQTSQIDVTWTRRYMSKFNLLYNDSNSVQVSL